MSDTDLIAQFLAKGGKVTVCPPRTFALEAYASMSWKEQRNAHFAELSAKRREKREAAEVAAAIPAGQVAAPQKAKASRGERASPPQRRLPAHPLAAVVSLLKDGMSVREAAAHLGASYASINSQLRRAGVKVTDLRPLQARAHINRAKSAPRVSDDQIIDAVKGRTAIEAADHLGLTADYLRRRLRAIGVKPTSVKPGSKPKPMHDIIAGIEAGLSVRQVGEAMGLTHGAIVDRMARAGISVSSVLRDLHTRTYGHTRNLTSTKARGKNLPKPCVIGESAWPDLATAADDLGVPRGTLKTWLRPDASSRQQARMHRAVAQWLDRQSRRAA